MRTYLLFFFILLVHFLAANADNEADAYSFSRINHQQGLSNSAVLCLFQDNEGLMWFGTYDGVNCWDGKTMDVFRSDFSAEKTLSNNVIHSIQQADSNCLWITSHLGANRFSKDSRQVVCNYEFSSDFVIHSNSKGNTWALGYGWISYYNTYHHRFVEISMPDIYMLKVDIRAFVTNEGELILFPYESGDLYRFSLDSFGKDTTNTRLDITSSRFHPKTIEYVCYQNGVFYFYDSDKDLFMYDISLRSKIYIRNIADMVRKYGTITGIVPFYEDIVIAFQTNGLIRLRMSQKYSEEIIDRTIRIFAIYNDPRQGILWIGTDGQGAIMFSRKYSIATNIMLRNLCPNLSRQVRSILTDKNGGLWFGTKGDGLVHFPNYLNGIQISEAEIYSLAGKQKLASYVKLDREFQIYSMLESRYKNGFWIGTGSSGLCWYSFDDKQLYSSSDNSVQEITDVHSIFEANDSTLYLTSGKGFSKVILCKDNKKGFQLKSSVHYRFSYEQQELNLFYCMVPEGDSLLWLGSRQKGLVCFNRRTDEYQVYSLNNLLHKSVDDILCLHRYKKNQLYVGTTSGLVCVTFKGRKLEAEYIGREHGLLNDMIHSILEDDNGLLWLGTNRGLIKFNPDNFFSHAYYYRGGVQIGEFSDDAYFRCPYTGNLFFGGIDGLLYLDKKVVDVPEFYPEIILRKLLINESFVNLKDYYHQGKEGLQMKEIKISFSLFFVVPDYANGGDVEYSYMLEGFDKEWSAFSSTNKASYFNIPSGKYLFKVRYKKDVFNTEYKILTIPVHIHPPWYLTVYAYFLYLLTGVVLTVSIFYLLRKYFHHERMMKKLLETEGRNVSLATDGYQEREVINNCTIIYQACDQLNGNNLSQAEHSLRINQIRESVMSLLFGCGVGDECFRLLSSLHFSVSGHLLFSKLAEEVLRALEKEGYDPSLIRVDISDHFTFPAYKNALRCIFYFCFLYIVFLNKSEVTVTVKEDEGRLNLLFHSSDDTVKGLQEAITGQEPLLVKGKDSDNLFRIRTIQRFVFSALKQQNSSSHCWIDEEKGRNVLTITFEPVRIVEHDGSKKTVLLLEDREEIVWLITSLLSDEYEVHTVRNIQAAFNEMRVLAPTLFLVDMLMYTDAESTFIKYVDKNRSMLSKTAFIPMLTWKVSTSVQRDLILWADSYVVFPYDIPFLRETIHKAIFGKREAKPVYMEELEGWGDSIVCTNNEQADFIRKFIHVIEQNLDREDLGSTFIAKKMLMSPRQFGRKLKEISGMTPSDLIKEYRMERASRLLRNKDFSIQDVIADVGISSRAYFYKEFTRKYGVTPKVYRANIFKDEKND